MKLKYSISMAAALVVLATTADAQQHNQTDLQFTRERASIAATEQRISSLRQRVGRLASTVSAGDANQASSREHVLLSRGVPTPAPTPSSPARARAQGAPSGTERRATERLRHRDRAVTGQDVDRLQGRLNAAAQQARSLGERVNRPDFGAGLRSLEQELGQIEAEIAGFEQAGGR